MFVKLKVVFHNDIHRHIGSYAPNAVNELSPKYSA